jgi:hypothetical protein
VKTTIGFYNFGSVGQNEIDNIVGSYSYSGSFIPRIEFITNNRLAAFGDNQLIVYEGTQKPEEIAKISLTSEVKSIFFNENYLGTVVDNPQAGEITAQKITGAVTPDETDSQQQDYDEQEKESGAYQLNVYDIKGNLALTRNFDLDYSGIEFLSNGEICIYNMQECELFTMGGTKKFSATFTNSLYQIFSGTTKRCYTLVLSGETQKILLK